MGEIGRVQRPDPAVNAPNLLGRVQQAGDQKHRQQHEEHPTQEDTVELHDEEASPQLQTPPARDPAVSEGGLDLAV